MRQKNAPRLEGGREIRETTQIGGGERKRLASAQPEMGEKVVDLAKIRQLVPRGVVADVARKEQTPLFRLDQPSDLIAADFLPASLFCFMLLIHASLSRL